MSNLNAGDQITVERPLNTTSDTSETCSKCKHTKPLTEFYRSNNRWCGRLWCKECTRQYRRGYYRRRRELAKPDGSKDTSRSNDTGALLLGEPTVIASKATGNESADNPWARAKDAPTFVAEEDKEFTGLAKDLLVPGAVTLIASPRGIGKTQVSHALGVALATGGIFRGEQVQPARVLLLDRDNPRMSFKESLYHWGADKADNLRVLTRQDAPDLKNKAAWRKFPLQDYEVLIIDSVGSTTEGITEKEGKQTTEVLATIMDLARQGLAVLLLQNTTKDAANLKGRGEWADRVDILYEVRDATDFTPSGKKPWWQELPEAGEAAWADRAARRKGRVDFRLAFIPSKYRLGQEPEPFCLEIRLPKDQPWSLRDVTSGVLKGVAGEPMLAARGLGAQHPGANQMLKPDPLMGHGNGEDRNPPYEWGDLYTYPKI